MSLPSHGTWQRYVNHAEPCRQACCRDAWRRYRIWYDLRVTAGIIERKTRVSTDRARVHVAGLRALGISDETVAAIAGVGMASVRKVTQGQGRITVQTEAALLAVRFDPAVMPPSAKVNGIGARRRIQALVANGWTFPALGRELGCSYGNVGQIARARYGDRVTAATWVQVRSLYERLWDVHPDPTPGAAAAKRNAARHGWLPPMAWDDDTIDLPDTQPHPASVRTPGYDRRNRASRETVAEIEWYLHGTPHATATEIAARLGNSGSALYQALSRVTEQVTESIRSGYGIGPLTAADSATVDEVTAEQTAHLHALRATLHRNSGNSDDAGDTAA